MPGWDDRLLTQRGSATFFRDREGGAYYQRSFSGAAASGPDLLIITSFNEWPEGSQIEPSNELGSTYLDLTSQLAASYKAGSIPVAPAPPVAAAPAQVGTPLPTITPGPSPTPSPTPSPVPSPTANPDGRILYEVQAGDTLLGIATRFGIDLVLLYQYNQLPEGAILSIGQPIVIGVTEEYAGTQFVADLPHMRIEPDGRVLHVVQPGDTAIGIALTYGLTLEAFYEVSGLNPDSLLQVDQEILVAVTPQPQEVGGSAQEPLPTVTPRPTETATPAPPSATPTGTATAISVTSRIAPPTVPPPTPTPVAEEVAASAARTGPFLFGIVVALLLLGSGLLLLSRRL
jgi:LysM repeat protein